MSNGFVEKRACEKRAKTYNLLDYHKVLHLDTNLEEDTEKDRHFVSTEGIQMDWLDYWGILDYCGILDYWGIQGSLEGSLEVGL